MAHEQGDQGNFRKLAASGLVLIVLIGILAFSGVLAQARQSIPGLQQSTPTYQTTTVSKGNISVSVTATGPIAAVDSTPLTFKTSGKLAQLKVGIGQQVTRGQVLAILDTTDLQTALNEAKANLDQAQANLTKVQSGVTQAQKDVAQVAVDNAKTAAASAQASVATSQENAANSVTAAQDSVHAATLNVASAQAQAAYDAAKTNLDAATLVAPFDATVAETNGAVGQYVNGGPVAVGGSSLFTLMDLNNLQVTTQVNEADIGKVHVVDYNVTCSIQPTKGATLYPGMTATATIVSVEHTGVLNVPNSALSFAQAQTKKLSTGSSSTSASTSAATIFTLKNGRPTSEPVTLGITDGTNTEVVSGLQAGETILLGQSKSSNGSSSSSSGQRFGGRTVFGGFP